MANLSMRKYGLNSAVHSQRGVRMIRAERAVSMQRIALLKCFFARFPQNPGLKCKSGAFKSVLSE